MNKTILDFINFLLKEKFLDNYKKFNNRILYEHLDQIDFLPKIFVISARTPGLFVTLILK